MLTLSLRNQIIIGLMLTAMMILTRGYNLVWTHNLADASWAVFFLAGIYLRSAWPLLGLFLLSWVLDYVAYAWGGVSDFCLTPAYLFLIPAMRRYGWQAVGMRNNFNGPGITLRYSPPAWLPVYWLANYSPAAVSIFSQDVSQKLP